MIITKFLTGFLTILIALLLFTVPALADTTSYHIEELYMDVDIPNDGYILTRDIAADDPVLDMFNWTNEELLQYLISKNTYLSYMAFDTSHEINITKFNTIDSLQYENFNNYSDDELHELAQDILTSMEDSDVNYTKFELYNQENTKYIVFDRWKMKNGEKSISKEYRTHANGQSISITLFTSNNSITSEMESKLKGIVDSIVISAPPITVSDEKEIANHTYHIKELHMNVSTPDDGYTLTRDIAADDPTLKELNITQQELVDVMKSTPMYLFYINKEPFYEIIIDKDEYPDSLIKNNYNKYSDAELEQLIQEFLSMNKEKTIKMMEKSLGISSTSEISDMDYLGYDLYTHGNVKYIVLDLWMILDGEKNDIIKYYTIYNGQSINIYLISYDSPITNEMETTLKGIVDSIEFTQTFETNSSGIDDSGYTDENRPSNTLVLVILLAIVVIGTLIIVKLRNNSISKNQEQESPTPQDSPYTSDDD